MKHFLLSSSIKTATYFKIRDAIVSKQQVIGRYNGFYRELCPHAIGYNKAGGEQALFYQFGGYSSSGKIVNGSPFNWRCIPLNNFEVLEIRKGEFYTSHNHSQPQTCIKFVDVEVNY